MIPRYTDHAANERTYLAWIRTAIAIMAFGFFIEKFDLFIDYITATTPIEIPNPLLPVKAAGVVLVCVSLAMILVATIRFHRHRRAIENADEQAYGETASLVLSVFLAILVGCMLYYMLGIMTG